MTAQSRATPQPAPALDLDALHTAGARLIAARRAVFQKGGPAPGSLWELALAERAVLDLVAGGAS